jgi:hypothetical protein
MDVSTQSKEDNAKAAEKAADASRDQAAAARDNTQALIEETEAVSGLTFAKRDLADFCSEYPESPECGSTGGQTWTNILSPEILAASNDPGTANQVEQTKVLQRLEDYIRSWVGYDAGTSQYTRDVLDGVQAIWDKKYAGEREAEAKAREAEAQARKAEVEVEAAFASIYGTGPQASQASADPGATSSASTSAQPVSIDTRSIEASITSALQNMSVAPASAGSTININIEGVLDINDSATLESLARKLQPIFADLTRRGL